MPLSHRDNFLRMIRGEKPERLPLDLPATPPIVDLVEKKHGTRDLTAAFDLSFRGIWTHIPADRAAWLKAFDRIGANVPPDAEIDSFGVAHIKPPAESTGAAYHFRTMLHPLSPITSRVQLETLPWPSYDQPAVYGKFSGAVAKAHAEGRPCCGGLECTVFEFSWYLRGMDNLFMDLTEDNGIADFLLDYFTGRSSRIAEEMTRAGTDCICLGDDVGTQRGMMMSVDFWRTHLKGRLARVIASIRNAQNPGQHVWVRYHSDGDIREIIDDLIEIGVDILNPMQPECMPPDEVIARYKNRIAFWGLIGTQTLMPFGTPAQIRTFVDRCAAWHKSGARLIVAPTHVLEPDVPYENIVALVDAVKAIRL